MMAITVIIFMMPVLLLKIKRFFSRNEIKVSSEKYNYHYAFTCKECHLNFRHHGFMVPQNCSTKIALEKKDQCIYMQKGFEISSVFKTCIALKENKTILFLITLKF